MITLKLMVEIQHNTSLHGINQSAMKYNLEFFTFL